MTFSEVREYQPGDEVRTIDWNVTARFNHPYVKVFQEERELSIILLVDVSKSGTFGTQAQLKQELITELSAVISFSAMLNNDKVGVLFLVIKWKNLFHLKRKKTHTPTDQRVLAIQSYRSRNKPCSCFGILYQCYKKSQYCFCNIRFYVPSIR